MKKENDLNSNNSNEVNTVSPIAEVKVEASDSVVVEENNLEVTDSDNSSIDKGVKPSSSKPPKDSNVSTVLLVLLFVFMFAFVMGMPYIRQFVNELKTGDGLSEIEKEAIEEEKRQEQEENKKTVSTPEAEQLKELNCTLLSNKAGIYTLTQIQKFYYNSKNQIMSSKVISKYTFTNADDTYNSLKEQCEVDSLKYLTHEGYTIACSNDESNVEISHEFDLETFTPIIDDATNIYANATYKQDINTVKVSLTEQGYTCE